MNLIHSPTAGAQLVCHDLAGQGRPVVFLHGLGGSGSLEYPAVAGHAALGARRRILVDLPGHGASAAPADFCYSTTAMAQVAQEVIAALCPGQQVVLFGHSMGGAIAIELAERLGADCALLILAEANTSAGGGLISSAIAAMDEAQFVAQGHAQMRADADNPARALIWGMADPRAVHRCATALERGVSPGWFERLTALPMRRVMIHSERHAAHPDILRLEKTQVVTAGLPDSGHGMALDNPAGLAGLIAKILEAEEPK